MRLVSVAAAFTLAAAAAGAAPAADLEVGALPGAGVTATLDELGDGTWRVRYVFDEPQRVMFFSRSGGDYRTGSWTSLDDGVTLERVGGFDALLFAQPVTSASFRIAPYTGLLEKDTTPFIPFSDGGVAVFGGQFELLPAPDREAIAALGGDLSKWDGEQPVLGVRILSDKPMIVGGEIVHGEAIELSQGDSSPIYVGDAMIQAGADFAGVIDPGLPEWLRATLDVEIAEIFSAYRALWGDGLPEKATILFAFGGDTRTGLSNSGSAMRNQIVMRSEGSVLRNPDPRLLRHFRWFFAHEIAHLFQGRSDAKAIDAGHEWMVEGGANAMANIVLERIGAADRDYTLSEYARSFDSCVEFLKAGSLAGAARDGRFEAFYACGDLMARMTDAALPDDDLFSFWNALLAEAAQQENRYSQDLYFFVMLGRGADANLVAAMERLANDDLEDPRSLLIEVLDLAGLNPQLDGDGRLVSLKLPLS